MFTYSHTRLLATLLAAVNVGLAMILANGIPPDLVTLLVGVGPMLLGAALSQWLLYPLFSRRSGGTGVAIDGALWLAVIAVAGLFAGTFVMPGAGTILGPMVTLSLPLQSPLAALVYLAGATLGISLIRRAKAPALLQPSE